MWGIVVEMAPKQQGILSGCSAILPVMLRRPILVSFETQMWRHRPAFGPQGGWRSPGQSVCSAAGHHESDAIARSHDVGLANTTIGIAAHQECLIANFVRSKARPFAVLESGERAACTHRTGTIVKPARHLLGKHTTRVTRERHGPMTLLGIGRSPAGSDERPCTSQPLRCECAGGVVLVLGAGSTGASASRRCVRNT